MNSGGDRAMAGAREQGQDDVLNELSKELADDIRPTVRRAIAKIAEAPLVGPEEGGSTDLRRLAESLTKELLGCADYMSERDYEICIEHFQQAGGSSPARVQQLEETLQTIADFAVGHGDVCEIIAKRARAALAGEPSRKEPKP
jgi:hypothetical protein